MYDPKEVFTKEGLREHENHLYNLEKALSFLSNNADDLGIGSLDDEQLQVLYNMQNMLEVYKNGDGEKPEED